MCGKSERFPGVGPKWLLTHPTGNCMLAESIKGLYSNNEINIIITLLKEHIEDCKINLNEIKAQFSHNVEFIILDKSESQVSTIEQTLFIKKDINNFIVKDCDNYFKVDLDLLKGDICIGYFNLDKFSTNPNNKDYISTFNGNIRVFNLKIRRNSIANKCKLFCGGIYYFQNSIDFLNFSQNTTRLSEVINNYSKDKYNISTVEVKDYLDWGTLEDWNKYISLTQN